MIEIDVRLRIPSNVNRDSLLTQLDEYFQRSKDFRSFEKFYDIAHWSTVLSNSTLYRRTCVELANCEQCGRIINHRVPSIIDDENPVMITIGIPDNSEIIKYHEIGNDAFQPRIIGHDESTLDYQNYLMRAREPFPKPIYIVDKIITLDYVCDARNPFSSSHRGGGV